MQKRTGVAADRFRVLFHGAVRAAGQQHHPGTGDLPGHFILPVGVPDFAVGLTALPMAWWASRNLANAKSSLIAWNVVGASIFLSAGILMHVSMPGPVQLFTSGPTTHTLFEFPLALVPTFLVPCFVATHLACLWKLIARAA